ncbi:hypothetical protein CU044_6745 [Streptomyces sp. L-9-10]|nr:hypothetical protein CU044_6745 [Streptomyces sp. L-9-10]
MNWLWRLLSPSASRRRAVGASRVEYPYVPALGLMRAPDPYVWRTDPMCDAHWSGVTA